MFYPYINKEILSNNRRFKLFLSGMRTRVFRTDDDRESEEGSDKPVFYGESMDFQDAITAVNRQIRTQLEESYIDTSGSVEFKYKIEACLSYGTFVFENQNGKVHGFLYTKSEVMKDLDVLGDTFQEALEKLFEMAKSKL